MTDYPASFSIMKKELLQVDANGRRYNNLNYGLDCTIRELAPLLTPDVSPMFNSLIHSDNCPSTTNNGSLTDGVWAKSASMGNDSQRPWFRFTRGEGREMIFDFGSDIGVSAVRIGFLKEISKGILPPHTVTVSLSLNGQEWMSVFRGTDYISLLRNDIVRRMDLFSDTFTARYVRIAFDVAPHVFIDEIEILGEIATRSTKKISPDTTPMRPNAYATYKTFGFKDTFLSYLPSQTANKVTERRTCDWYLPHVAYLKNGKVMNTLFDSFIMLPYVDFLYKGESKRHLTKKDWLGFIKNEFTPNLNISALNTAVAIAKQALFLENYQVSLFLPLFYPESSVVDFGKLVGKTRDFTKSEDRFVAIQWMIDEQMRRFHDSDFHNLKLRGFYWFTEEMDNNDPEMERILKQVTNYIRNKGLITIWIPYYQAAGYERWQKIGFDLAIYQSGYAFDNTLPIKQLLETSKKAKQLHMGVEMEIEKLNRASVTRFQDYLQTAMSVENNSSVTHMYYQGIDESAVLNSYLSNNPELHLLYENINLFIHRESF
ncbi:DUF4855 domain-containing protein [Lapidilactobacillus achengensis]|uniref:DUF4855 domain-containing protein n=1 Tax=Lapidilactobacillus achengensis TaxID=2486000 RepID=A0ABW1UR71_9LACO|nr:DUF4855 domain-containing protein [Lapidilactobacillus achengensis]